MKPQPKCCRKENAMNYKERQDVMNESYSKKNKFHVVHYYHGEFEGETYTIRRCSSRELAEKVLMKYKKYHSQDGCGNDIRIIETK